LTRNLFWAAFGCAVAWGLIDGVMYVLTCVFERSRQARLLRLVRDAPTAESGQAHIAGELDDSIGEIVTAEERAALARNLYDRLRDQEAPPGGFRREDWAGALGVAIVAVLAALPVVLPLFIFSSWPAAAIRLSNLVAFISLYLMGYGWGKYAGGKPHRVGLLLLVVGVVMVLVAIPLGG
jgi:VIT1/CCC1 family predicted Fe2+/Mn2+ transporter